MYTSYNGSSRSKSTTDVYRASTRVGEFEDDSSYPPASYSTLSRLGNRRRRGTTASTTNISRVRSYLTDDVCKQFEHGFETSTSNKSNDVDDAPPSNARSNNFVKRLVETLERRQREQQQQQQQQRSFIGGSKIANHEFYKIGDVRGGDAELRTKLIAAEKVEGKVFEGRLMQEKKDRDEVQEKPKVSEPKLAMIEEKPRLPDKKHGERLCHEQPTLPIRIPRVHARHLEDLYEHEDEYISSKEDYLYHALYEQRETSTTQENDSNTTSKPSKPRKMTTARRTLKNVISTIKGWRLGPKSLPKGSRDYYATRESLGEEMRAFHRDTLPRLMEHAQVKSLGVAEQRDKKLQTPREFTNLIGSPSMMGEERQRSTATIHTVYGAQGRLSRFPDVVRVQSELVMDEAGEVPHCSKKVVPPSVPPSQEAPEPEPLVRPSEVRDIEKRYSSDSGKVQLRRCLPAQLAASTTTLDVVYDVPRPITPVTEDVIIQQRLRPSSSHEYANISGGDAEDHEEDKRLHCTAFTTF